jgi:ketosteroid isomerase-like protein
MSQENVDKSRAFIDAYNRRDFDEAVENFHPQIDWVLPAMQGFDSCIGPDQVKEFWYGLEETFDEFRLDAQEFVDAGERVAVRLRYYGRGKGSGAVLDTEMYHQVATFVDGTIVRLEYFADWGQALEAAGASPPSPARDPR